MSCVKDFEAVEIRINEVLTQYRESPKLLHLLRTYLRQVEIVEQSICDMPDKFDLDTAVGDQLTLLGKRMGFPRLHCICDIQPVFGFACSNDSTMDNILGFCTGADWKDCSNMGISYVSIDDDELYRRFLKARRYQIMSYYDRESLKAALREIWGNTSMIMDSRNGRVVVAPGRDLTDAELGLIQIYPRVLPIALGIEVRFHFGPLNVFGFGNGWGGFCDGEAVDGQPLLTEDDDVIYTESDDEILTDNLGIGADWLCAIDVRPYEC